jgi:carbon storage regulator CsrA
MLVLTRKQGEAVVVEVPGGPSITVRVCNISGDRVRVGVDAPEEFVIFRPENENLHAIPRTHAEG